MKAALVLACALVLLPLVAALPAPTTCGTECEISMSSAGYMAPVVVLATGSSVVWTSTDIGHTASEGPLAGMRCFDAVSQVEDGGVPSPPVRFDIVDGALYATVDDLTLRCSQAQGNAEGGFAVTYLCTLHPTMRGTLVVVS